MCYYLYGSLYGKVSEVEYRETKDKYSYKIALGTKHDPNDPMIVELSALISELSGLSGAKQINICKTWTGKLNKREIKLKLEDIDLHTFLADMQENCLYSIEF